MEISNETTTLVRKGSLKHRLPYFKIKYNNDKQLHNNDK